MTPSIVRRLVAVCWAVTLWGLPATAAEPPQRVVSFNVCTDELVVALADPSQIAGISPYASDPAISTVADQARAFRRVSWQAESTIPLDPDLVLVGFAGERSLMQQMLRALGFNVVKIDVVADLAGAYAQIRKVAALLGHPERGEALIAEIDAARAAAGAGAAACAIHGAAHRQWRLHGRSCESRGCTDEGGRADAAARRARGLRRFRAARKADRTAPGCPGHVERARTAGRAGRASISRTRRCSVSIR